MVYTALGDYGRALEQINRSLSLEPGHAYFLNNRGFIYLELNALDKAREDIDASIASDPDNAWAYRNKGIYYLKTSDGPDAIRMLTQAANMDKFVEKVYFYLGEAFRQEKKPDQACTNYKKSANNLEKEGLEAFKLYCSD